MTNIKPVSELRNYSSLLEEVTPGNPVYLTKNGHGEYVLLSIEDQEIYERNKAAVTFMCEMNKGILAGERDGWLTSEQIRKDLQERKDGQGSNISGIP